MRSAFLLLACLLFAASPGLAQTYDVVGLVTDEDKGEPIGQVEILTKSGKTLGYTKSDGRYEITVNSSSAILVFKRHTYETVEVDLASHENLIGVDVFMKSAVLELASKDTVARRNVARDQGNTQTIEELENFQGMKTDMNDHLRQLPGVSGMNEFTRDISVWGSRTEDVTHYLGQTRIPSLRHLDIGFPGNQSVINPRLLKSITLADNLAKGPVSQGNASALVYDLKEGDPNNIHLDLVFGTVNRELNATGYWGGRTFLVSGRYLEPTFLSNLGTKFYTETKDARIESQGQTCDPNKGCKVLEDPFDFLSGDLYVGTFYRDSTGAFGRHSFLLLDDSYRVKQDVAKTFEDTEIQELVNGTQDAKMYAYEGLSPFATGDLTYSFALMQRKREETFRDSLPPGSVQDSKPWFPTTGSSVGGEVDNLLGHTNADDLQSTLSLQWNSNARVLGGAYGYGVDFEYAGQERAYKDINQTGNPDLTLPQDYVLASGLYRLRWGLSGKRALEAAAGAALVFQGAIDGDDAGFKTAAPIASLRYSHPFGQSFTGFGEAALRQNTAVEPTGYNRLGAVTTSSVEGKAGVNGGWGEALKFGVTAYSRVYKDPTLPVPEVFWNYRDARKSDWALVNGGNVTAAWTPIHHLGMNVNASAVQGDYHLTDDSYLPWEANRTLDLVYNLRILPRRDSLLSIILTYGASNGAPLYEYTGLWSDAADASTLTRAARQSTRFPEVSRQRTDVRVNLDLKSKWRPLDAFRLFFEADNIFANQGGDGLGWLGGDNRRRRGWTRANETGNLEPVVTKGMGLYIMFGFEGKLLI